MVGKNRRVFVVRRWEYLFTEFSNRPQNVEDCNETLQPSLNLNAGRHVEVDV